MPISPVTTEKLQQQLEELTRRFERAMEQEADFRRNLELRYESVTNREPFRGANERTAIFTNPGCPRMA